MNTTRAKFNVGEQVTWSSQAGGRTTVKTGVVAIVVPPGQSGYLMAEDLRDVTGDSLEPMRTARFNATLGRDHESYLVRVGRMIYWPVVSRLREDRS